MELEEIKQRENKISGTKWTVRCDSWPFCGELTYFDFESCNDCQILITEKRKFGEINETNDTLLEKLGLENQKVKEYEKFQKELSNILFLHSNMIPGKSFHDLKEEVKNLKQLNEKNLVKVNETENTRHELEICKKDILAQIIEIQKLRTEKQNFEKEIQILHKTRLDKSVEQENIELKKSQNESQNLENCKKDNLALKIEIRKLRTEKEKFQKEIQTLNNTKLSVEQENIELKKSQNESQNLVTQKLNGSIHSRKCNANKMKGNQNPCFKGK